MSTSFPRFPKNRWKLRENSSKGHFAILEFQGAAKLAWEQAQPANSNIYSCSHAKHAHLDPFGFAIGTKCHNPCVHLAATWGLTYTQSTTEMYVDELCYRYGR